MENARHISIEKTNAAGWEFEMEVGSTTVSASLEYVDSFEGWLSRVPAFGSANPDIPALLLKRIKGSRQEGGLIKVSLGYEGNDSSATYPGRSPGPVKLYHIEPGAGEDPIVTHKMFKDLSDEEREAANALASSARDRDAYAEAKKVLTSDAGNKFIEKIRKGIDSWRGLGVVWVERFTTNTLADVGITKIYKTTSDPPGGCPNPGENYNWLRLPPGVSPRDDGKHWDIENRWELSLYGKWDPDLYPAGG